MQPIKHTQPRWERRKEARPGELLEAALELFVERGFAATRLEDVAKKAGVSKGTLYLYFSGKEELFKAVVRETLLPKLEAAEDIVKNKMADSIELFRYIIHGWWEQIGNTRLAGLSKLVLSESGNFPELAEFYHKEFISRGMTMIAGLLERGMAQGEFRRVDSHHITQVIIAPVMMLMMWKHSFGASKIEPISPEVYLNSMVDLCLHGLVQEGKANK
ncbi:MAG: TetR/AcrR family transcriptional regulator [Oxalobacter sp.]|nr:MAG: TetR/AcrR family transcriptional regulator [Oxalobacter sp.]